jgi:hypothetical protein
VRADPPQKAILKIRAAVPTYRPAPLPQPPVSFSIADVIRTVICVQGPLQKEAAGILTTPWDSLNSPSRGAHVNLRETLAKHEAGSPGRGHGRA